jgi:hypothetical protein
MKNLKGVLIILFVFIGTYTFAQELPKGFRERVSEEFKSLPKELEEHDDKVTFDEYYERRKNEYILQQKFYLRLISAQGVNDLCANGTFESGDINVGDWNFFWSGSSGGVSGTNRVNTGSFNSGGAHGSQVHHQVQSAGADPHFSALNKVYNFPTGNSKSLRLGNANPGCGLESVAKVITITPSNATLNFSYAIVMDNPANHGTALPFFEVNLIDASNTTINYNNLINLGNSSNRISSNNPLLVPNSTSAPRRWKDWECVTADLSSLIGKTIIVEFVNRDCWACGHWSYTYIDNLCVSCDDAPPGKDGDIKLDVAKTDSCGIPGQICVAYTLPSGTSPGMDISLQLIQNGVVVNTLTSPTLTSGSSYCFQLNTTNTSALNTSLSGFDYKVIGVPKLGSFFLTPKILGSTSAGIKTGVNNDYDIYCPQCCPGKNLVQNGSFNAGNTGFTSAYTYQPTVALSSVVPGEYSIINGSQAATISPTWANVQDPTSCSNTSGNFLVVNGENGGAVPPQKVIWEQTITVKDWTGYKFCMKAKNLDQCGFNITPKIDIVFSMPQLGNITETINITSSNPCDWKSIEKHLNLWGYGTTLNIKIILDQTLLGDGNDLAIDDIALIELPQAPIQLATFGVTTPVDLGGGFFSFQATPSTLPGDCYFSWEVCELDSSDDCISSTKVYNPSQWWNSPFNFPGYNGTSTLSGTSPGKFSYSKKYRITRGVWCECSSWNQYSIDVNSTANSIIFTDPESGRVLQSVRRSGIRVPVRPRR